MHGTTVATDPMYYDTSAVEDASKEIISDSKPVFFPADWEKHDTSLTYKNKVTGVVITEEEYNEANGAPKAVSPSYYYSFGDAYIGGSGGGTYFLGKDPDAVYIDGYTVELLKKVKEQESCTSETPSQKKSETYTKVYGGVGDAEEMGGIVAVLKSIISLAESRGSLSIAPLYVETATGQFFTLDLNIKKFSSKPWSISGKSVMSRREKIGIFLRKTIMSWLVKI